ncbi:helicase domain protein [Nitzschia inconspicua]|uniref:Helicase domain protein n=1 Tax=Nitzschia inconspicua TaxID=303405 RepID=A0A9K3KNS7_9STRA|nr:helicase domain protein [Nitzschia inconspicua]
MAEQILLSDNDVLSGHKHKWSIIEHPGNKFLESLVDQFCDEYLNTPTQYRHLITNKLIDRVRDRGGRFLKIVNDDQLEPQDERAIAGKITKLLRLRGMEFREIRQRQDGNTTGDKIGNKKRLRQEAEEDHEIPKTGGITERTDKFGFSPSPSNSARMRINHLAADTSQTAFNIWGQNHRTHAAGGTNHHDYDSDDGSFDDGGHSIWQSFERNSERVEDDASWNVNYRLLLEFYEEHGHAGVSSDWDGNPELAEWATKQRQLFREIQSGYRIPTLREDNRWKQLQKINFPLNYEKWHWERKYGQLKEILMGEKYDAKHIELPKDVQLWLDHQRTLMKSDGSVMSSRRMEHDQKERLKCLGV